MTVEPLEEMGYHVFRNLFCLNLLTAVGVVHKCLFKPNFGSEGKSIEAS